jgi:uncharacterized protein
LHSACADHPKHLPKIQKELSLAFASSSAGFLVKHLDRAGLRGPNMKSWYGYICLFYAAWLFLVAGAGYWQDALSHWHMAAVMAFGSVVAGSTPMGGGTVSFPVLVLLFHQSANLGRNFAMAIQALGMTSAMIFIFCRRVPVLRTMLAWGMAGAAVGLLIGTYSISPHLSGSSVKLLFASVWVNFGILTLLKNKEVCSLNRVPEIGGPRDILVAVSVGILGGIVNSIIGVGIEMVLYSVLVLRYRCDLKIAVPTSVSMGALTSILAIALHAWIGDIGKEVFYNWLAAAPIVVLGAPFGTYLVSIIPRIRTLYFVSALCVFQFIWTLSQVTPRFAEWIFVGVAVLSANLIFHLLYRLGKAKMGV